MTLRDEIGAHMSIAGGLHLALERGRQIGCGAVQIFLKNQRQWAARPLAGEEVRAFRSVERMRSATCSRPFRSSDSGTPSEWSQRVGATIYR